MAIPVQKLHPAAQIPAAAHGPEDAAVDLTSVEEGIIPAGQGRAFGTGLAFALPQGTAGLVWDRSGLAFKSGITVLGGLIDSGYRGEVKVFLLNTSGADYTVKVGDRIANFLVVQHAPTDYQETTELTSSERGAGGFGSTGA